VRLSVKTLVATLSLSGFAFFSASRPKTIQEIYRNGTNHAFLTV